MLQADGDSILILSDPLGAEDCSTAEGERSCNKHGVATWDEGPGPTTGKS